MRARAIDHINIRAPKALVDKLKAFYERVLGLAVGWRPPFRSTGHWLYLDGQPLVHLVEDERVDGSAARGGAIIDHVAFSCRGLREFTESLNAEGIPFRRTDVPGTSLVQLLLVDPAGNGVELQFDDPDS